MWARPKGLEGSCPLRPCRGENGSHLNPSTLPPGSEPSVCPGEGCSLWDWAAHKEMQNPLTPMSCWGESILLLHPLFGLCVYRQTKSFCGCVCVCVCGKGGGTKPKIRIVKLLLCYPCLQGTCFKISSREQSNATDQRQMESDLHMSAFCMAKLGVKQRKPM